MPKPFDFHSYEFPREALRIGNCDYGSQISLFSTPIFQYRLKDISICQEVSNLVKSNISNFEEKWINYQKGSSKYIHNTLTSDDDLHLDPKFNSLLNAINPIIKITIDTLNLSTNGFDILSMWSNINGRGGYLATHSHLIHFYLEFFICKHQGVIKVKSFLRILLKEEPIGNLIPMILKHQCFNIDRGNLNLEWELSLCFLVG